MENIAIPIAALIISLATLVLSALGQGRAVRRETVDELRAEVNDLTARIKQCEDARVALAMENHQLLLELLESRRVQREG